MNWVNSPSANIYSNWWSKKAFLFIEWYLRGRVLMQLVKGEGMRCRLWAVQSNMPSKRSKKDLGVNFFMLFHQKSEYLVKKKVRKWPKKDLLGWPFLSLGGQLIPSYLTRHSQRIWMINIHFLLGSDGEKQWQQLITTLVGHWSSNLMQQENVGKYHAASVKQNVH